MTHVYILGVWCWRFLTLAQYRALPHVQHMLTGRKPIIVSVATGIVCAAGIGGGVVLSPYLPGGGGPNMVPIVSGDREHQDVPEPGGLLVLAVGIGGVAWVRRKSASSRRDPMAI